MKQILVAGLAMALGLFAVETRTWRQTDFADFEKGSLKRLSLRSDGRLTVAPVVKELLDASTGYLWACAIDSKGTVYVGGGSTSGTTAKLFAVDPAGKSKVAAELDGMEIHAIAIDSKDAVYAATAPDGKVYKVARGGGKAEVFFDPKAKYIWALVFAANGDLFVGTGDKGEIWRVSPEGKGAVYFHTDESHARSLALDGQGNLIAGTEPSGLVLRITGPEQGFVLQQTAKREVTGLAIGRDGAIYAAAVGTRASPGGLGGPLGAPPPAPPPAGGAPPPAPGAPALPAAAASLRGASGPPAAAPPAISGGSDLYRIEADGYARRIWSHASELVYTIAMDAQDRPVIGTGNKGGVFRMESNQRYTLLTSLAPTQVTHLVASGTGGALYAVTGNIGKLYQLGPGLEQDGVFESDVFDAGAFTYWGRAGFDGSENGGHIRIESRSGNVNSAQRNWSGWSAVHEGRVASPAARFLQYRLTLSGTGAVDGLDVAYEARNVAPVVERVEATPANYRFPAPAAGTGSVGPAPSLTLPALGQKRAKAGGGASAPAAETSAVSFAKGFIGVRWAAGDENGDALMFRIDIRGANETEWKLLRDKVREHYYSWDSTAFADGEYVVRVTASDGLSNTPDQTLTASLESEPFLVDNAAPEVQGLAAVTDGGKLNVAWTAKDAWSNIVRAEYSVNGGDWTVAQPLTRLSDAKELSYRIVVSKPTGEYTIAVRITDEYDNQSAAKVVGR